MAGVYGVMTYVGGAASERSESGWRSAPLWHLRHVTDPLTDAGVATLLALLALAASYIPARRAMQVDPLWRCRRSSQDPNSGSGSLRDLTVGHGGRPPRRIAPKTDLSRAVFHLAGDQKCQFHCLVVIQARIYFGFVSPRQVRFAGAVRSANTFGDVLAGHFHVYAT
jgi:hypothetical protein